MFFLCLSSPRVSKTPLKDKIRNRAPVKLMHDHPITTNLRSPFIYIGVFAIWVWTGLKWGTQGAHILFYLGIWKITFKNEGLHIGTKRPINNERFAIWLWAGLRTLFCQLLARNAQHETPEAYSGQGLDLRPEMLKMGLNVNQWRAKPSLNRNG